MGGERELTLFAALLAGGLAITGQNLVALGIGALLWFGCIGVFRQRAKSDPQMSLVYRRYIRFRGYYPARSRPFIGNTMSPARQWAILLSGTAGVLVLLIAVA